MPTTFPRLLLKHAAERPAEPAMREKEYGIWQARSWADMALLVEQLACGLHEMGLRRGEHMVVIGSNRPQLYATLLAIQSLGAIPVPLYQDAVAAECVFPITNAEERRVILSEAKRALTAEEKTEAAKADDRQLARAVVALRTQRAFKKKQEEGLAPVPTPAPGASR